MRPYGTRLHLGGEFPPAPTARLGLFCWDLMARAILAVFLLGLLVFERTRFAYWLASRLPLVAALSG